MNSMTTVCGRDINVEGQLIRIARLDADKYHFLDDPTPLLSALRNCGTRIDLFTFLQRITEPTAKFAYPMEWDNLAALPVSTYEHWWSHQIRSDTRNRARQAEKRGVTLQEVPLDDALVHGIAEVYNESQIRQGKPFRHYGKDIETLRREASTYLDFAIFIGAFLNEKLIGFVKLVTDETRTQANLMHIVAMMKHRDKAPTNALIAHSVRVCAERRIPHLVYQNFSYGKKGNDTLSHFKEINGFKRVDLPRYYVPLSRVGQIGLRLGLHHKLADRIPESIAARLRQFRNSWYNRRFHSATESS